MEMPMKNLKAVDILEDLESKLAYIPGGRDHDGRPLIVINVPPEFDSATKSKLEFLILYFISIFSDETKENGLVLIVDARHSAWRVTKSCIRLSTNLIESKVISVIVIRPDGFWDKRVDSCTKSHKEGEPLYVTLTRLHVYIDFSQLPYELAGNKAYNHVEWIKKRMKIENYSKNALALISKMTNLHQRLNTFDGIRIMQSNDVESYWEMGIELLSMARHILQSGRNLVSSMSRESSKDILDTIKGIHKLLDCIELKQMGIENLWTEMERNLDTARVIENLEQGVSSVTDWILGPADVMLNSCCQVGFDVSSSEELRRQHEKIELQCRETYGRYAELLHKIDSLPKSKLPEDLKSQRDFMDFVCRSFASRLERRRNVLITSQRFFRLVSEYFDKTSEVFEQLVMGNRNYNFSQASIKLLTLEKSQTILDSLERELVKEGEKLSDILSMPVKDALGREVHVYYDEDIVNVKDILDATNARKNIFNDSVELQKLSLKQIALIYMYESDAEQAVKWLNDLFNVLLRNHMEVGCNVKEIQLQKEEHQSFQETAKGTYEYGGQLVNGARVLRLSCRISLEGNANLSSKLRQAWRQFRSVSQEQLTRLRVCAVFHRNVEDHCIGLQNLAETVTALYYSAKDEDATAKARIKDSIRDILDNREKLLLEVGRMVRLGRLLKTRLKEPLYSQPMSKVEDVSIFGDNLTAVEAISAKLAEVTRLAEKLDARLCEAGAKTRPMSIPAVVTSSASSLLSISATSPSNESMHAASNTTTLTSNMTASAVSVIAEMQPIISETVATKIKSDVIKSITPTVEKFDDSLFHIRSQSMENVEISNKDLNSKELIENSRSESAIGEYNMEGYTTATECSTTPPPRSRSESFVTSPECEDLSIIAPVMTYSGSTWWTMEKPKLITTIAPLTSFSTNENQEFPETTSNISTISEVNPTVRMKTMDKITNEKSNKIIKEVTETTVLRVLHDIRLGVASYKVISNTVQDHRQYIDVKDIQNVEDVLEAESREKTDDIHHHLDLSSFKELKNYTGKNSKKMQLDQNNATKIREHVLNKSTCSNLKEYEDIPLPSQNLLRHHEDSEIEISSMKKDDNLEDEDFLEKTRKSGEWLKLKILELQPELTKLGASVKEAMELSNAHDQVLLRLQNKQSPVEELLRQADQLITTQRPRAEVYTAMAETLGQAWRDINQLLERRKKILDRNILFQCRAAECRERMEALEMACNNTLLPIEIEAVKSFLSKIQDLRKDMLEGLMGALREGKTLLDGLKELVNEGTLDSRSDTIKDEANHVVLRVEKWLEELHDRRRLIETTFRSRKIQLEQCLALALLATDLRNLEEILNDRIVALESSCNQLGDSVSNVELLLFELKKLQVEAKEFQDKAIKITKSTERLVSSGHFAGEQATEQAFAILSTATDYINDLDQYNMLLDRTTAFFDLAQSAITKLDQLEIQLITTEYPSYSSRLARLHAQIVAMIEDVISKPLSEGYALLDITGREAPGAEGVRNTVEKLENRKFSLMEQCTAHKKENLEISRILNTFLDKHNTLQAWLSDIVKVFFQKHQNMGSDLAMACDFRQIHCQLLAELENKSEEVDHLELEILPIIERLDEMQKYELQLKIKNLEDEWTKTKITIAKRIELSTLYMQFYEIVNELTYELDFIDNELKKHEDVLDEARFNEIEERWKSFESLYKKLNNHAKTFLNETNNIDDFYLNISQACVCVQTLLEKFANRQLIITEWRKKWQITVQVIRQRRMECEQKVEESKETLAWITKFEMTLYPVITTRSSKIADILDNLQDVRIRISSKLNKALHELDTKIKSNQVFVERGEAKAIEPILEKLVQMHEKVNTVIKDYDILLESLIFIFRNLEEIERKIEEAKQEVERASNFTKLIDVDGSLNKLNILKTFIMESLLQIRTKSDKIVNNIRLQEPLESAIQDIEKLNCTIDSVRVKFELFQTETSNRLEEHRHLCIFREDIEKINYDLRELNEQLKNMDGRIGDNLSVLKATLTAFEQFEQTITILDERIETFVKKTEETIVPLTPQVTDEILSLRNRWDHLRKHVRDTKKRMHLSNDYFVLLEEAKQWFREGNKLLVIIARKATAVKVPEEAIDLLQEIDAYIKPGEDQQEKRIEKLKQLSTIVFGTDRLPQFNEVIVENRQMLDSFAVISSELRTLSQNLQNAEDLREKLQIEKLEADKKLQAVKIEMAAMEAAKIEAENAKKLAEQLAAETLDKAAIEAKKLKEEHARKIIPSISHSVSAQTDETIVEETIHKTSAVTTKEIHILQKMEIEKDVPVIQKEASPSRKLVSEEICDKLHEYAKETQINKIVSLAPEFTVPLNDATVQEGKEFSFECHLIGQPIPEIVWYKDGISILNNPDYLTTYTNGVCTLKIEETFTEDSAKYTCRAFNIHGSVETSATLTVKEIITEEQSNVPVFVKELQPSFAIEGCSHKLECTVKGNPLPTVQWYKNDTNIDNSPDYIITFNNGEAVLKFDEVFLEDKASYTCKAANQWGQSSTTAYLDVKPAQISVKKPYFVEPLSNAMVRVGQRVKLECEANGDPIPKLIWTHDGKLIEESKYHKIQTDGARTSLIITETFPKDAGSYAVTANNEIGKDTTSCIVSVKGRWLHETSESELVCSDIELIVPKFQLPLQNLEIQEGRSARLDCVIVGQPEPEVIWYHDKQPVKESSDFQLLFQGDRCSLVIHEAFLDDAGIYKVVAINSAGEASSQCTLTVMPTSNVSKEQEETLASGFAPKFIKFPTDLLVAESENAIFECVVIGEPKPDLRWYSDDGEMIHNERILIGERKDGTAFLEISSTIPKDKGNYVAKAINIHGEAKAFARLVVKSLGDFKRNEKFIQMEEKLIQPTFKETFQDRKILEGVSTKFECIVIGKPSPKIQWLFNERPVHGKDFLVSVSGDRQVLTIPIVRDTHVGTISCVAENAAGRAVCNAKVEIDSGSVKPDASEIKKVFELIPYSPTGIMHPASSSDKHFLSEKTYHEGGSESQVLTKMSSTVTHSSTTSMKKEFLSSTMTSTLSQSEHEPTSVCTKTTVQSSQQSTSENGAPPVVQSHKIEEYEKIVQKQPGEMEQKKTVLVCEETEGVKHDVKTNQIQRPSRKLIAPRFISPITGIIVDQGTDVVLEGTIDGFPQPTILWSKNGQELTLKDNIKISYAHNHVKLELKNVNAKDAGRYTCTVSNDVGTTSSTADLVVKKTIFPPVFGKRLKAQVIKKGDRVIMEVEITGIPEPIVNWYKNDVLINEQPQKLKIIQQGNCYTLVIDKAKEEDAGKYMVRATNAGGEAQSIADIAVFEPKPDTMVEVHKTVIYENIQDKNVIQSEGKKEEISSGTLMSKQIPTTALVELPKSVMISSTIDTVQKITEPEIKTSKSEMISSTIESHETETKSEQTFHMKLEHKTPSIVESKPRIEQTIATKKIDRDKENVTKPLIKTEEKSTINNENIETSTIVKKDALSFFESITKESEIMPKGPKEMIKLTEEGQIQEAKVGKLTKNYEQATIYQETKKPEVRSSDLQTMKKAAQDIFTKLEQGSSSRGVENKLFEFPYESSKLPSMEVKKPIEEKTFVDSPISQLKNQTENFKMMMKSFDLVPEPPPEICYMPKPEEKKKQPDVFVKAKQLQESFDKTLSPIDAPIGGVKIFPTSTSKVTEPVKAVEPVLAGTIPPPFNLEKKETFEETCIRKKDAYEKKESKYFKEEKMEPWRYASTSVLRSSSPIRPWSSSSDVETKSHVSTDLSEYRCHSAASSQQEILRSTSPKPSADALAMEKSWAKKCVESNRKSWPPQIKPIQKYEWNVPIEEYKSSSKEFQQKIEETPEGTIKKISTESSANVEKQSWCTKEKFTEKIIEASPPAKLGPIIYNAETIKVDHTVNTMQEKDMFEKYITECNMKKSEMTQKSEDFSSKCWTEEKALKAPRLVKRVEPATKSLPIPHRLIETDSIVIKPGSPPEMGYISPSFVKEKTRLEHTTTVEERVEEPPILPPKDVRITPPSVPAKKPVKLSTPLPSKFVKGSFSHESDYESDFDSRPKAKWRPYESDNEEPHYRKVKAPVPKQSTRPRSTEPEPLPPSKFETPAQFTEPSSLITTESSEKAARKIIFKRHEREVKQQQQQNSIPLKPGSPPIYVQPSTKSLVQKSPVKKPESPKFKTKIFQQESGYMADTDEPFQQKASSVTTQKFLGKHDGLSTIVHTESRTTESRTKSFESHSYETDHLQKEESSFVLPSICSTQATPKAVQQRSLLEKSYESATDSSSLRRFESTKETGYSLNQLHKKLVPAEKILSISPSPSKLVKGDFRESDYESDDGRILACHTVSSTKFNVADSDWPLSNGVSSITEVIQPYIEILPKKAPTFITPLKDIAVISGQPARFECIVQAEPQPNILWSKDNRIVENSKSHEIQYRNGICRLTIMRALPEDAGTYACTATNSLGSTITSANLEVPGNRRSIYAPIL
ncbi:PREDICTED: titin-like isoform X4 [Trachymyrmex septentrionalis]|uniref:titin-like isoform X4 n=1 Tax=Trachymyrmex septentrionalis TaxID=34720 RepID=UPI00084F52CA|nr:PREDICTED: titin-like isoform X4 [Trachymyrmex septentrionalis]